MKILLIVYLKLEYPIPYNVILTDITYLFYGDNKKYYLSTIKDAETNESEVVAEDAETSAEVVETTEAMQNPEAETAKDEPKAEVENAADEPVEQKSNGANEEQNN